MGHKLRTLCFGPLLLAVAILPVFADPIRILILSGQNNHAWQETTPKLRAILDEGGRFQVDVKEHPEGMTREFLAAYGGIVSNWNNWGVTGATPWSGAAREALIAFVADGKGYVSIHAGSSSFYDWEDYKKLSITSWDLENTSHGPQHLFKVLPSPVEHPITAGMEPFATFDELWNRAPVPADAQVLATAYSAPEFKGTGKDEPILFARSFGKGRSVNFLLGHHARAMSNPAFAELFTRSVEWAVTRAVAERKRELTWSRNDASLALALNGHVLWQYNYGASASKPFFHPLTLGTNPVLTMDAPSDHPWHHGLWFSWKYINGVNFWEENRESGQADGRTRWETPEIETSGDGSATIRMKLNYEIVPDGPVLTEARTIGISKANWLGGYTIQWDSLFTALASEVLLDRTPIEGEVDGKAWGGYAGLSVRLATVETPEIYTDLGLLPASDTQSNIDARALDISGLYEGRACGIAIVPGQEGARLPTPWYTITQPANDFFYVSPALLYRAPRTLKAGETLALHYKIVVHEGGWSEREICNVLEPESPANTTTPTAP